MIAHPSAHSRDGREFRFTELSAEKHARAVITTNGSRQCPELARRATRFKARDRQFCTAV